jgi:hypothetical protein
LTQVNLEEENSLSAGGAFRNIKVLSLDLGWTS